MRFPFLSSITAPTLGLGLVVFFPNEAKKIALFIHFVWLTYFSDISSINNQLSDLHSFTTKGGTGNSEKTPDKDNLNGLFLSIF